jgi:predicted GNAT family acetyltransferase
MSPCDGKAERQGMKATDRPRLVIEISAICTDTAHRGQGLASRLVHALVHDIRRRGQRPFPHAAATNTGVIRLYQALGFTLRRRTTFTTVRTPDLVPDPPATAR